MTRSLMTGVSGLRAHQQQLDVVANNLANMNTIGFKSQTTTFSDVMYDTLRPGSGSGISYGGINPQQIGTGVQISQVSRNFSQGALQATGELLDFAIQGDGFFSLSGATGAQMYTRSGSFTLDDRGNLVDPSTGSLVQRTGQFGESTSENFGFQVPGDNRISIPLGAPIPGEQTRMVEFFGNLSSDTSPPMAEVLSSAGIYETTTGPATLATSLNGLTINDIDYGTGDQIEIAGTNPDGSPFSGLLSANGATMGDLINEINALMDGATASLQPNGVMTITADDTGEAFSSITIKDADGNVGGSDFFENAMLVSTDGHSGDMFESSLEVYDKRGNGHRVNFSFRKESVNGWSVTASLTDESGQLIDDQVLNLNFNEDGTYALAGSAGTGDTNIEVNFDTIEELQTIELSFEDMNHMATNFSISQAQDGTPPGTLVTISTSAAGEINGLASNGKVIPLAQLAIARFANVGGLEAQGGNFYHETLNSGAASIGSGQSNGRGQIIGNQLESSNVDIAQQFTQLIVAQRGFSANARTITVADEILEELTNIVR